MNAKFQLNIMGLLALAFSAVAADKPRAALTVAVYDFTDADRGVGSYGGKVTTLVTADLTTETNLAMVERSDLQKTLGEQAIGLSGMVSSETAAKIGQLTGAKVLVTGQVIKTEKNHLIIVANIIGTETGRLFAIKAEGAAEDLMELTSDLSGRIAKKISDQTTNLIIEMEESHEQRLKHIVDNIQGTNRPAVTVAITFFSDEGRHWRDDWADYEFGLVLLKAGFAVLDGKSDRKADVEIVGNASGDLGPQRGELLSYHTAIDVTIRERRSGAIIGFDRQESTATGVGGKGVVGRVSHINAVDELAARILPLLAK